MSNFKLEFTLKQHTPLIHFQHDHGATLRATEVKARLDKFLIAKFFQDEFEPCKKYLVGYSEKDEKSLQERFAKGFRALNYKLRIQPKNVQLSKIGFVNQSRNKGVFWEDSFPCFFANMGKENKKNPKWFSFCPEMIPCTINSVDSGIIELLKDTKNYFLNFFLANNFGARNGKGFGSFTLETFHKKSAKFKMPDSIKKITVTPQYNANDDMMSRLKENGISQDGMISKFNENGYADKLLEWLFNYQNLFLNIDLFYRTLRSGINIPKKLYFKSLMFHYAKKDNWQWDKKTLRLFFYGDHPKFLEVLENRTQHDGTVTYTPSEEKRDIYDFRDLLGLATEQQWQYYDDDTLTKEGKALNGDEIERFKSPFNFKIISMEEGGFVIYILPQAMPRDYLGAMISTKSTLYSGVGKKDLSIPEDFSAAIFLDWAIKFWTSKMKTNKRFFAEYRENNTPREITIINNIYTQLSKQI